MNKIFQIINTFDPISCSIVRVITKNFIIIFIITCNHHTEKIKYKMNTKVDLNMCEIARFEKHIVRHVVYDMLDNV